MNNVKELKIEDLSTEQKLGMAWVAHVALESFFPNAPDGGFQYVLDRIRAHAVGAVWVDPNIKDLPGTMAEIREAADYPILIMCDAEGGFGKFRVGGHNPVGRAGDPKLAYAFGKATAVEARKAGYNVICNPVLDMCDKPICCGVPMRSLGGDKYKVTELAAAMARGIKDVNLLTVAKHYPGTYGDGTIDPHMAEATSPETAEELVDYSLYPYIQLNNEGLLDGLMTAHTLMPNIDPDFPASLSQKVINVIRDQGFDGFAITDALVMSGSAAKFGARTCRGLAIANGNDLALTWSRNNKDCFESIVETYEQGLIADDRLDEAVRHVLEAQHKTLSAPKYTEVTDEEAEMVYSINRDFTFVKTDDGVEKTLSRDGHHCFVMMVENEADIDAHGKVNVDTMDKSWYHPAKIEAQLKELFPNSDVRAIPLFPSAGATMNLLRQTTGYDDLIYITFYMSQAYVGEECFTSRLLGGMRALQITDRISTIVHFGNPFVLEDVPHIPRVLVSGCSSQAIEAALEALAGEREAKGVLTYDVKFQ